MKHTIIVEVGSSLFDCKIFIDGVEQADLSRFRLDLDVERSAPEVLIESGDLAMSGSPADVVIDAWLRQRVTTT